jgi:hypothetical protein
MFTGNYFCLCVLTPAATPPASGGALTIFGGAITAPDPSTTPTPELLPPWPLVAMNEARESLKFDFELVWCENGGCLDQKDNGTPVQDVNFSVRGVDPPHTVSTISQDQQKLIRLNALNALKLAFAPYNVTLGTGKKVTNTVYVSGLDRLACGITPPIFQTFSWVYFSSNTDQAQHAINETNGMPTPELLRAIGEGIGNNAAHEVGHQLVNRFAQSGKIVSGIDMDDTSTDTYNGGSCDGSQAPWVFTGVGANGTSIIPMLVSCNPLILWCW